MLTEKIVFLPAEILNTCAGHKIPQKIHVENENWQILKDEIPLG